MVNSDRQCFYPSGISVNINWREWLRSRATIYKATKRKKKRQMQSSERDVNVWLSIYLLIFILILTNAVRFETRRLQGQPLHNYWYYRFTIKESIAGHLMEIIHVREGMLRWNVCILRNRIYPKTFRPPLYFPGLGVVRYNRPKIVF